MKKRIYMDHAATTPLCREAERAMRPYLLELFANPSSACEPGKRCRRAVEEARERIASLCGARAEEIYFTAGGTEADNWAVKGLAENRRGGHIITSAIEHPAVLETCRYLEGRGYRVTYVKPDAQGVIWPEAVRREIRRDTFLISVMTANNEVGTIQPVAEIGALAENAGIFFHTDAVQAFAQIPLDVNRAHIGLFSAGGHKFGGPKGVGFLYMRTGVPAESFVHGGSQERGRRAGTEHVAGIVGMAAVAEAAFAQMKKRSEWTRGLRERLIRQVLRTVPRCRLNGSAERRLPGNANFSFAGINGRALVDRLDADGICVSSASACSSKDAAPSHVLTAMGFSAELARSALRVSLGPENTPEEVDFAASRIAWQVAALRNERS